MEEKKTPLNNEQTLRLINVANLTDKVEAATMVQVGCVKKFNVQFKNYSSDIFLHEEDIDLIMNGITLERE